MQSVLTLTNLTKYYGALPALNGVSLNLPQGRIIGLLGPNGSGKTTLLKLCAGLLTPSHGEIRICGVPVGPDTKGLVSYLPDRTYLTANQTVRQQLDLFRDFYEDFDYPRAEAMLKALEIDPGRRFGTLSKGTKEKVQLVMVMARRAKLYLLDEPIAGVDPAARDYILHTIIGNYNPEATVVITTHLIHDIEPVLDEFAFMGRGGEILLSGVADDVRAERGKSLDELFREVFACSANS